MDRTQHRIFWTTLLLLLPAVSFAAPPPYWPYPPSPYYYPPPTIVQAIEEEQPSAETGESSIVEVENEAASSEPHEPLVDEAIEAEPLPSAEPEIRETEEKPEQVAVGEESAEDDSAALAEQQLNEALSREIALDIQQGNFAEAYYLWRPRAEAGDAEAQYGIGWMYHNGYGLAINDQEAITWWQMASHQGHPDAAFALGMLFALGEGDIKRDMEKAVDYYHQATLLGHEDARLLLLTLVQQNEHHAHQLMLKLLAENRLNEISDTPAAEVISERANVRSGSSTQHKILTTLKKGHGLFPLKRQGRWLLVGIAEKNDLGWIHDSLVGKDILKDK